MRVFAVGLAFVSVFVVLFFSFAPEDRVYKVTSAIKAVMDDPAEKCLEHYGQQLEFSSTTKLINSSESNGSVMIAYRYESVTDGSKVVEGECVLTDGKVDDEKTHRANETYQLVDAVIAFSKVVRDFRLDAAINTKDILKINDMGKAVRDGTHLLSLLEFRYEQMKSGSDGSDLTLLIEDRLAERFGQPDLRGDNGLINVFEEMIKTTKSDVEKIDSRRAEIRTVYDF